MSQSNEPRNASADADTSARTRQLLPVWVNVDTVAPLALFVVAAIVYVKTLCPTIFADDCGEIATAVATGGVMHPPGYPLYTVIGRLFIEAIPFGEAAWRLGLLSALSAAGAVACSYKLARRAGALQVWSVAAALSFAFSLALWRQATKVETYALNALFATLILNAAAAFNESGKPRDLVLTALACGLGLANHLSIVCVIPAAIWLVFEQLRGSRNSVALSISVVLIGAAPLGLYGLIWIAAAQHPGGQVWGNPSDLHRFILQVTGARYHGYMIERSWLDAAQRDLVDLPALLWRNLGWLLVGVVPGAARGLWMPATRRFHQALAIALVLYLIETSSYGILNIFEYYTPIILLLCIWAGVGMDAVVSGLLRKTNQSLRLALPVQAALAACACFGALTSHWDVCDRSHATYIRDLAINTLSILPPHAVLLSVGDNRNFPLWYVQDVSGYRRDVVVVPRNMLTDLGTPDGRDEMSWLLDKLHAQHPRIVDAISILNKCAASPAYAQSEGPTWDIATRALDLGRPVFMTDVEPGDITHPMAHRPLLIAIGPKLSLEQYGLVYRIMPVASIPDIVKQAALNLAIERRIKIRRAPDTLMQDEPDGNVTNVLYAQMLYNIGDIVMRSRDFDDALADFHKSANLNPSADTYDTLGSLCLDMNRVDEALRDYSTAVALDPGNSDYQFDLSWARKQAAVLRQGRGLRS